MPMTPYILMGYSAGFGLLWPHQQFSDATNEMPKKKPQNVEYEDEL